MAQKENKVHFSAPEDDVVDLSDIEQAMHYGLSDLAQRMRTYGNRREDPVREIFALLGDRWSTLILLVLDIGCCRHTELRRILSRVGSEQKISQRVMTLKLRNLERNGIVLREVTHEVPPKVCYSLAPMGQDLASEAKRLLVWAQANSSKIRSERKRFDANIE